MNPPVDLIETCLIVDDHAPMRALLGDFVSGFATRIVGCANGIEALEAHLRDHPSLILIDVDMPEMNGIEATQRIVARDPNTCIIVVTQHDDPSIRLAAREAGAWGFVPKSDLSQLQKLLSEMQRTEPMTPTQSGTSKQSDS